MAKLSLILVLALVLPTSASLELCSNNTMDEVSSVLQLSKKKVKYMDQGITTSSLNGCLLKLNYTEYSEKLQGMSSNDKRNTVIVTLDSKGKGSISDLQGKNDEQLFSICWQIIAPGKSSYDDCLLKTGERFFSELPDMSDTDKRNTELVMLHKKGKGSISDLQNAGSGQLYSLCFEEILLSMQCYMDRYPVVADYYGKGNLMGAEEHFDEKGEDRKLDPQCRDVSKFDDSCNWQCYLDNNPRLGKIIGKTNTAAARKHYDAFGYREGRLCTCTTTTTTTTGRFRHINQCGACYMEHFPWNKKGKAYGSWKKDPETGKIIPDYHLPVYYQSCVCDQEEAWCRARCADDVTCRGYSSSDKWAKCQFATDQESCPDSCVRKGEGNNVSHPTLDKKTLNVFCGDVKIDGDEDASLSSDWNGCWLRLGSGRYNVDVRWQNPEYKYYR